MSERATGHRMLDAQYDQPEAEGPARLLAICTTPRTGSHRLGRALYDLGLGVPAEYFHPHALATLCGRWGLRIDPRSPAEMARYWRSVLRHRTRNGIAALSLFGYQMAALADPVAADESAIYLRLTRRNRADQIASLIALYQTKAPYDAADRIDQIPDFSTISGRSIRILSRWIDWQDAKWARFLEDKPHIEIASEDFFRRPLPFLRAILDRSGRPAAQETLRAAGEAVARSQAYRANAQIKRRILEDYAGAFAELDLRAAEGAAGR